MAESPTRLAAGIKKNEGMSHADGFWRKMPSRTDDEEADGGKRKHSSSEEEDIDGVALEDAEPKKMKVSMGFSKTFGSVKSVGLTEKKGPAPITIKLGAQKTKESKPVLQKTSASVASAFNQESDEEEMPPEAKMRMRNIGRCSSSHCKSCSCVCHHDQLLRIQQKIFP